jgi:hypothetical protein
MAFILTGLAQFAELGVQLFGMKSVRNVVTTCEIQTSASTEFYLWALFALMVGAVYGGLYLSRRSIMDKWNRIKLVRALTGTRTMLNSFAPVDLDGHFYTYGPFARAKSLGHKLRNKSLDALNRNQPSGFNWFWDSTVCCLGGPVGLALFGSCVCILVYIAMGWVERVHDCHTHTVVTLRDELQDIVSHVPETIVLGKLYEIALSYLWYGMLMFISMFGALFGCCSSCRRREKL